MNRILTICCLILAASLALAAPPRTLNYQGTLTDNTGLPVADGNYTLTFRLWNASVGGSAAWSEAQSVNVTGGVFNVILGVVTPLSVDFENQLYLGVQVGVDPELSPRTPMTSVPSAFNVVDGAAVTSLNGRTDDVSIVAGANVSVVNSGQNIIISSAGALSDADWALSGNDMTSIPTGNVGIGAASPSSKLHVDGTVRSGDSDTNGLFESIFDGSNISYFGGDYGGFGSEIKVATNGGGSSMILQPDVDDQGGYLQVNRSDFSGGLIVDGNYNGSNSTRVSVVGSGSTAIFDASVAGNSSVQLGSDAIGAVEILDEAGLASAKSNELAPYNLTTTTAAIVSRTITAPSAGYVIVTASYEVDVNHTSGTTSFSTIGVSSATGTLPDNQDHSFYLPSGAASGTYLSPASAMGVFPVTAGSSTFYLNGRKNTASVDIQVWDVQLTVLFVPTAYGTVTGTGLGTALAGTDQDNDAPGVDGPSMADLAAERAESEQVVRDRVAAELAAMRDRIAELESLVQNGNER
ncbi:MAG TPA: hypothetical protein P5571_12140 [Candidatus Krumholzibacteria bacterium]|nr:hypothetical protein [Candidatus Krumholzibacteria bacterium]HRX52109.1 hypothetical protein [Candidatus Krumholzibacteria bacterium]